MAVNALGGRSASPCADGEAEERGASSTAIARTSARVVRLRDEFDELQARIGYRFRDRGLLEHALTHKSRAAEDASGGVADNESLEFLGDAVLGLVVADALFRQYPDYNEGQKSKIKAAVVSTQSLARHAEAIPARRASDPRARRGEDRRPLQAGAARRRLRGADRRDLSRRRPRRGRGVPAARAEGCDRRGQRADVRARLQVGAAGAAAGARPAAAGVPAVGSEAGPDHRKTFSVEVVVNGEVLGAATGRAKKEAEQEAARLAPRSTTPKAGLARMTEERLR